MSSTSIYNYQAATSLLSLRSPGVPIFAYTKKLVIIAKRKNHIRI